MLWEVLCEMLLVVLWEVMWEMLMEVVRSCCGKCAFGEKSSRNDHHECRR